MPKSLLAMFVSVAVCLTLSCEADAPAKSAPAPKATPAPKTTPAPEANPAADAATVADFEQRVRQYLILHRKLEATLPKQHANTSPEEIDRKQRKLGELLKSERPQARQGEFFTPEMQHYLRRLFDRVFSGTDGKNLLGSIMDENPGLPEIVVNERYPDTVPLSTMPPEVLSVLPQLEEDMEYRFVGRRLVLFDVHGHLIVDFTDELLPA